MEIDFSHNLPEIDISPVSQKGDIIINTNTTRIRKANRRAEPT